jgi:hypothetical protein
VYVTGGYHWYDPSTSQATTPPPPAPPPPVTTTPPQTPSPPPAPPNHYYYNYRTMHMMETLSHQQSQANISGNVNTNNGDSSTEPSVWSYFENTWVTTHYATFILALFGIGLSLLGLGYLASRLSDTDKLGQVLVLSALGSGLDVGALAHEWVSHDYVKVGRDILSLIADSAATLVHYFNVVDYIEMGVTFLSDAATGFISVAATALSVFATSYQLYMDVQNDYNKIYG